MKILYSRGKNTFMVKYNNKTYFVVIGNNRKCTEIDDITAQELLQSGFWTTIKDDAFDNIKHEILSIIKEER